MRMLDWKSLSPAQRRQALQRPALHQAAAVTDAARGIIEAVRRDGDAALLASVAAYLLSCRLLQVRELETLLSLRTRLGL